MYVFSVSGKTYTKLTAQPGSTDRIKVKDASGNLTDAAFEVTSKKALNLTQGDTSAIAVSGAGSCYGAYTGTSSSRRSKGRG